MSDAPRILLCSQYPLTEVLGAPKVLVELAAEMRLLDVPIDTISPADLGLEPVGSPQFGAKLREVLRQRSGQYDVIEYEHDLLPYPRSDFSAGALMVARSVYLLHHLQNRRLPEARTLRAWAGRIVHGRARRAQGERRIAAAIKTSAEADLINVSNDYDRKELLRRGIDRQKITVLPFGISRIRRPLFDAVSTAVPGGAPTVAFVGTFDYRKGAGDFPTIVETICREVPLARFKLLGTKGLYPTRESVLAVFPAKLAARMEVYPTFKPNELPALLADCWCGIFPSYLEGFGFGVLEMLAAAVPVIAYDVPGPPEMIHSDGLVPAGAATQMAAKVVRFLKDLQFLSHARIQAQERSRQFDWPQIVRRTLNVYIEHLQSHRCSLNR